MAREKQKQIISISRRGDIPAFQYDWLQKALSNKEVITSNPMFPDKKTIVDLSPENTHALVLWSKNFKNVLDNPGLLDDYNLYFQYTITGYSKFLEPNVPEYKESMKTLEGLLKRYRPEQFNIRFDPIIISTLGEPNPTPEKPGLARLIAFERLCKDLQSLGMDNCRVTTSYLSSYGHVAKNIANSGLDIYHLDDVKQRLFMERMVEIAQKYNRDIYTCSNPVFDGMNGIKKGSCIDGELLTQLFDGKCTKSKINGQRKDCGCTKSIDIGCYASYEPEMACKHKCIYCYVK